MSRLMRWLGAVLRRGRLEREMAEEMQAHLALRADDLQARGVDPAEARRRARVEFGGIEATREATREALGLRLWDELRGDVRYGLRALRRAPGYTVVAVATLVLGIGAATAIWAAANALFFRPLPFREPDRLVHLFETNPEFNWVDAHAAPANVLDWRERVAAFDDVAMYAEFRSQIALSQQGEPVLVTGTQVSGNFFEVLGVSPLLGRGFSWEETFEGRHNVIVLSHALWTGRFGADPAIVGRWLDIGTRRLEVVGVMPPGFVFPSNDTRYWIPYGWTDAYRASVAFRRAHFVRAVARLAPGVSPAQADAELQTVVHQLQEEYPTTNRVMGAGLAPTRGFLVREGRRPVLLLMGAAALVLLLACVNTVTLALVRAADRGPEMAVRQALGAGRARLARQLVVESLLLGVSGGAGGLALGWAGVRLMEGLAPIGVAGATSLALDARVVGMTLLLALGSGGLVGVVPVFAGCRRGLHAELSEGGRAGERRGERSRGARMLVAVEVALALMLVLGAGLMLRTTWSLRAVDSGFRTDGVVAVQFTVPSHRYQARDQVLALYDRMAQELEARPGILRVGTVGHLPLAGTSWSSQFVADGWPPDRVGLEILHRRADPGYFEALGIPLVRGRMFDARDGVGTPLVVLVNEQFAREHFPGEDPVGRRITYNRVPDSTSTWYEIVGVVGDQQQVTPSRPARAEVFEHRSQDWSRSVWTVVRGTAGPAATLATVRDVLRELDPALPIAESRSLAEVRRDAMAREEFLLILLAAFGLVALVLAAVGVYGVASQAARRRAREVGIRLALGAPPGDVVRMMVRQTATLVAAGLAAGAVSSLTAAGTLRAFLFGVAPGDPATLGAVLVLLSGAALLAGYLPARRAVRQAPVEVLRAD